MENNTIFSFYPKEKIKDENAVRIYFTCHQEDFTYFEPIRREILGIEEDCVICYTEKTDAAFSDEDLLFLKTMKLFVIPVTYRLLSERRAGMNRAVSFDLPFAVNHGIRVLPLMMETDIGDLYEERFGELQYLDPNDLDPTAIPFGEKLKNYLSSALISAEEIQRVKDEFVCKLFLSYRKKDRKYANDVMKIIHKNPDCRDAAIWFDEFLTPGESFRENIKQKVDDCGIFILLITPCVVEDVTDEDGTRPNFIVTEEYPEATGAGRAILPVEMEETDPQVLKVFEGLPEPVRVRDAEIFDKKLSELVKEKSDKEIKTDSPEHIYYIGLAYLEGIDVERDTERGVALIEDAANAGFPDAVRKMRDLYRDGIRITADYDKALNWAFRLWQLYKDDDGLYWDAMAALEDVAFLCNKAGKSDEALHIYGKILESYSAQLGDDDPLTLTVMNNRAGCLSEKGCYEDVENLLKPFVSKKYDASDERYDIWITARSTFASAVSHIRANDEGLREWEAIYKDLCESKGEENIQTLLVKMNIADMLIRKEYRNNGRKEYRKSEKYMSEAYAVLRKKLGDKHPYALAALHGVAAAQIALGEFETAQDNEETVYRMRCEVLGKEHPSTLTALNNLAWAIGNCGKRKEAIEQLNTVYGLLCEKRGRFHIKTVGTLFCIARLYAMDGAKDKAKETLDGLYRDAAGLLHSGKPKTAKKLLCALIDVQKEILGSEDRETQKAMVAKLRARYQMNDKTLALYAIPEDAGIIPRYPDLYKEASTILKNAGENT